LQIKRELIYSGEEVGLISKAINKVEKKESLLPPLEEEPKPKGKKKFVLVVVGLLFIGVCLGLGYLFLLKPPTQSPPKVVRRSLSIKQKTERPALGQSAKNKDSVEVKAVASTQEVASPDSSIESVIQPKPLKNEEIVSKQTEEISTPEQKHPALLSESPTSPPQKESGTPKSVTRKSSEPSILFPSPQEEALNYASTEESKKEKPPADMTEDTSPPEEIPPLEEEEVPAKQVTSPPVLELKEWLTQKPFTVTEKSDSRAQRYYNKGVSYQ
jgi:hypothetical protein